MVMVETTKKYICSPESFEETYEKVKMEDRIIIDKNGGGSESGG